MVAATVRVARHNDEFIEKVWGSDHRRGDKSNEEVWVPTITPRSKECLDTELRHHLSKDLTIANLGRSQERSNSEESPIGYGDGHNNDK